MTDPDKILYAAIAVNIAAFLAFGLDKVLSKGNKRRISETALLLFALPLATLGAALAMILFNHKTAKPKFRYGIPFLAALHLALLYWLSL